ncbi:hypothetical protein [Rhodoferax sp. PAMC 29310]|uniref:hypothetical protein n=1 Tax=Rhodoferax sp. PAMC 29310 TaxID=2822760 RepID=UPI001B3387CD|nr:hypothetical protein [Rhodoferax sp. PAMC 29310]
MRSLLVFLMCFALAFQGMAGTRLLEPPCAMEEVMSTADNADDCCNDAAAHAQTGQLCKTGQACPSPTVTGANDLLLPALAPAASAPRASAPPFALSTDATGVWRPPSFL